MFFLILYLIYHYFRSNANSNKPTFERRITHFQSMFHCYTRWKHQKSEGKGNRKQESADLVTFTEETHNGKLHFLCSANIFDRVLIMPLRSNIPISHFQPILLRNRLQILLLILSKFKQINWLLFPLKPSENLCLSDIFSGNRIIDSFKLT